MGGICGFFTRIEGLFLFIILCGFLLIINTIYGIICLNELTNQVNCLLNYLIYLNSII